MVDEQKKCSNKKALRSCVRCRKNKIKCDLQETRPDCCTPCKKKGHECYVDFVVPHQRSQELLNLYQTVSEVKGTIGRLGIKYDKLGEKSLKVLDLDSSEVTGSMHSKVLKLGDDEFIFFTMESDRLCVNGLSISRSQLDIAFGEFRGLVENMLELYGRWEAESNSVSEGVIDESVGKYSCEKLFTSGQLPFLLCIVNFYFETPGLNYGLLFDRVLDDYCTMALEDDDSGISFDRKTLAKVITGTTGAESAPHFNGELFVKKMTLYLFYHIVMYGTERYLGAFLNKYIKTLENVRKKVNIEKNWEVKWVNFYVKIFDVMDNAKEPLDLSGEKEAFLRLLGHDSKVVYGEEIDETFAEDLVQCYEDIEPFLIPCSMRAPFFNVFLAQYITMNYFLSCTRGYVIDDKISRIPYNGFNGKVEYSIFEVCDKKKKAEDVKDEKSEVEKESFNGNETAEDSSEMRYRGEYAKGFVMRFENLEMSEVVAKCLTPKGYANVRGCSCCCLIKDLCETVIWKGMLMKI